MSVLLPWFHNSLAQAMVAALLAHICFSSLFLYHFGIIVVSCPTFPTLWELEQYLFFHIFIS